jgi:hypothetical protein
MNLDTMLANRNKWWEDAENYERKSQLKNSELNSAWQK